MIVTRAAMHCDYINMEAIYCNPNTMLKTHINKSTLCREILQFQTGSRTSTCMHTCVRVCVGGGTCVRVCEGVSTVYTVQNMGAHSLRITPSWYLHFDSQCFECGVAWDGQNEAQVISCRENGFKQHAHGMQRAGCAQLAGS